MKHLILLLLVFIRFFAVGQNKSSSIDQILNSDTVYFNINEAGCFHSRTKTIFIIKTSKNNYSVTYLNSKGNTQISNVSKDTLLKFGEIFKAKMKDKISCISTTSTTLALESRIESIEFDYFGCAKEENPMKALLKILNLVNS